MNKLSNLFTKSIKAKNIYLFLLLIFIIGVIFGSLFITIINDTDKNTVLNQITNFFDEIKSNKIDYLDIFKNSVISNLIYITFIWFLGISIIGIPIIIIMLFIKGFMIGFSITSIIANYKFLGILGSLSYIFPHIILSIIVILLISYHALKLSINLLKSVINKKNINFNEIINRYSMIMLISVIGMIIISLTEAFINPYIIKLFTILLK